ncbi:MAG: PadR family transcriptional regulator [Lachnospiraceae bacterium]|nr:PadR family transcriptional regulator [Lachnospiraceae bacterium]
MDAQIKKGILEMCLLYKLSKQDYYGYTLMKEMKVLYPEVNDSTFYAILRRLHKEGNTTVYLGSESGGPMRKYYKLTEQGQKTLQAEIEDWCRIKGIVEGLLQS